MRDARLFAIVLLAGLAGPGCTDRHVSTLAPDDSSAEGLPDGAIADAFVDATGGDAWEDDADAGCYRDPYLPDHYSPPCTQPEARPDCANGWCTIQPGCFIMGSPWCEWGRAMYSENPVQVTLTHVYRIQERELAQQEWTSLGLTNPSGRMADNTGDCLDPTCPVGNMTWVEALAFANLKSEKEGLDQCYELVDCVGELGKGMLCDTVRTVGSSTYECKGYRLPTGPEWEYAARAGTKTSVYTGDPIRRPLDYTCYDDDVLNPIAWYCNNSGGLTHPGGLKQPNGWGLFDMIGNASECVAGTTIGGYGDGPYTDYGATMEVTQIRSVPRNPSQLVMTRGGLFNVWPNTLRAAAIGGDPPDAQGPGLGLRLVQTVFQ